MWEGIRTVIEFQSIEKIREDEDSLHVHAGEKVITPFGDHTEGRVKFDAVKNIYVPHFWKGKRIFGKLGSAVIPMFFYEGELWFILGIRPHDEWSQRGKIQAFGGILSKGLTPFKNALKELFEELLIYDPATKRLVIPEILRTNVLIDIDYPKWVLDLYGEKLEAIQFISSKTPKIEGMKPIKFYRKGVLEEESEGFYKLTNSPPNVEIYYPLIYDFERAGIDPLMLRYYGFEHGGEAVSVFNGRSLLSMKDSYFVPGLKEVIERIYESHNP